MMYSGQTAIDFLATEISKEDSGSSSHWQNYHSEFLFLGNGFEGLRGFGGYDKPYRGLRLLLHRLFQRPFRRMGAAFQKFNEYPWQASDQVLVDELCPWHQKY
jgi:hypothetical protein